MLDKLERYRKVIYGLAFGLIAFLSHFVPAIREAVPPEAINAASLALALAAVYWFENRVDGWNVTEAADWLVAALAEAAAAEAAKGPDAPPPPPPAEGAT